MHRCILKVTDSNVHIDHKNRDRLDNRKNNLRLCTQKENTWNRSKRHNSASKYKGVFFNKLSKKWTVMICGKYVGTFSNEEDAAKVYNIKANDIFGEFSVLNDVDDWDKFIIPKANYNSTSNYRGVSFDNKTKKWFVNIS